MSAHSKQDPRPTIVKEKALQANQRIPRAGLISSSAAVEVEVDDGLCRLSGDKPFFDVILSKSHIRSPYYLTVPSHMAPILPRDVVPVVLTHGDKNWKMSYNGKARQQHKFEPTAWRSFVVDNNLQCGDACIFELMESSTEICRLRVVILRNTEYLPLELQANIPETECDGRTPDTAIEID